MPSILYSTTCYIKNDLCRLCISIDDSDEDSTNTQLPTESSDFTSTDILRDAIKPSLTQIKFELVNEKKHANIPKIIALNHLLNVQQTTSISKKNRRNFNNSTEVINTYRTTTPITEQSRQTSYTTLNTNISGVVETPIPTPRRQFSFGRLFSAQPNTETEANLLCKATIKISYVDVSNWIRWNVKRLEVEFETEDIANELYINLNLCLSTLKQRPHHLLAFVNPVGGKGNKNRFCTITFSAYKQCDLS